MVDKIKRASFVNGVKGFLDKIRHKYFLFAASAVPQEELLDIISYKGLTKYFRDVLGAPATKTELLKAILREYSLERHKVIFVRDAESDIIAARNLEIPFITKLTEYDSLSHNYTRISGQSKI